MSVLPSTRRAASADRLAQTPHRLIYQPGRSDGDGHGQHGQSPLQDFDPEATGDECFRNGNVQTKK